MKPLSFFGAPCLAAALLLLLLLLAGPAVAAELSVSDAFARATPGSGPSVGPGGAYLTIHGGDVPDRLVGVSSPAAGKVAIHSMAMEGDVMRMREVDGLDVPAGGTVQLKPGGLHLMLEGLAAPLRAGGTVPLTLRFAKAGERQVQVPVGSPGQSAPPHH